MPSGTQVTALHCVQETVPLRRRGVLAALVLSTDPPLGPHFHVYKMTASVWSAFWVLGCAKCVEIAYIVLRTPIKLGTDGPRLKMARLKIFRLYDGVKVIRVQ